MENKTDFPSGNETPSTTPAKKPGRPIKGKRGRPRTVSPDFESDTKRQRVTAFKETNTNRNGRLKAMRERNQKARDSETERDRYARLAGMSQRIAKARDSESQEERNTRLANMRHTIAQARNSESQEERNTRLENMRQTIALARDSESQEERNTRLAGMRHTIANARDSESQEERNARLANMRQTITEARDSESHEERKTRLAGVRHTIAKARDSESQEERNARLANMRQTIAQARDSESQEERNTRLAGMRQTIAKARNSEPQEERNARLANMRQTIADARGSESQTQRHTRLANAREKQTERRDLPWKTKELAALNYNPSVEYEKDSSVLMGSMTVQCNFCQALKWKGETTGMCCNNGKTKLEALYDLPEPLKGLMNGNDPRSKEFLQSTRKYNSAFQMTSFGAEIVTEKKFMPTFKVQGQVYHLAGSLLPAANQDPKFLQVYFMGDDDVQAKRRCDNIPNVQLDIIQDLQCMLHLHNKYIRSFKAAIEIQSDDNFTVIIHENKKPIQGHKGRYNTPTVNEVAVLIVGQEFGKRDIVLHARDNRLQRVSEIHRSYDALQYPLMFCTGEDGYSIFIPQHDPKTHQAIPNKTVSAMNFYAYRLMIRSGQTNHLHLFRQLTNQYWVDMYAKIESERLSFIRNNQRKLRVENYIHLKDAINSDGNVQNVGQLVILPSSFTGGPRYMHERTQDAMAYVRKYGRPDLFITFTCNPKWPDITEVLMKDQKSHHRHDIVSRVFKLKVNSLMDLLTKGKLFGPTICHMYSIEWQKRGLPHVHILLWLEQKISPNEIDSFISAELPDQETDPVLHEVIKSNMIHGPCGNINPTYPCMHDKKCIKRYPRPFVRDTVTGDDGYPTYRRRAPEDGGLTVEINTRGGSITVDNQWIVPYCPLLSRTFHAHINVEFCNSVKSIKYVCKYVNKGSDQASFSLAKENDEINRYQTGRYISTSEAVWRILSFPIHDRHPTVVHLAVHLENGQRVYFTEGNVIDKLQEPPHTTLTAYFELCKQDDFAKTLYYYQVPAYYTWNGKKFVRRKQGELVPGFPGIRKSSALGRVYTVHPNNVECYFLRMLLHKFTGPTSFNCLKQVHGQSHPTYQSACRALGLLEDDSHWDNTLRDAAVSEAPAMMRDLFVIMLAFCQVADPQVLWNNHKDSLSEDILHRLQRQFSQLTIKYNDDIYNEAIILVEDKLQSLVGKSLKDYGLAPPQRENQLPLNSDYLRETTYNIIELRNYVIENESKLVMDQTTAYKRVLESIDDNLGKIFFLDAPGGTGKTFLINILLAKIRSEKKIALAVASSGIAATLLQGGRTAHSTFKLPLNLAYSENPVCNIKKGTGLARVLQDCHIIIWDECTMSHKKGIEALNTSLMDLRSTDKLMGGITVVLSGDFRQILPVIQRGTRADEVNSSIKCSDIWRKVEKLTLTVNMRVHLKGDAFAGEFSKLLLEIGNGELLETDGEIQITDQFGHVVQTLDDLISSVYSDVYNLNKQSQAWICERAILTPKNKSASDINEYMLRCFPGEEWIYESVDSATSEEDSVNYPVEFLNSLNPPGMPLHKLTLKIGAPIMMLRNLNAPQLCNGTRLQVRSLKHHVIEATILTGCSEGQSVFIPRIPLMSSDYPFEFKRLQFPIKLCFAITINKAQGQSFKVAGIDLRSPCFSHGQLYVACSRVSCKNNLYILTPTGRTRNVVYKEALM